MLELFCHLMGIQKKWYIHKSYIQEEKYSQSDQNLVDCLQQAPFLQGFFLIIFFINHESTISIVKSNEASEISASRPCLFACFGGKNNKKSLPAAEISCISAPFQGAMPEWIGDFLPNKLFGNLAAAENWQTSASLICRISGDVNKWTCFHCHQ